MFVHVLKRRGADRSAGLAGAAGGTLLMEVVFAFRHGTTLADVDLQRDIPAIMGISVFISTIFVLVNLIIDLCYAWLDRASAQLGAGGQRGRRSSQNLRDPTAIANQLAPGAATASAQAVRTKSR
jgi:hypothetical protein